MSWLGRRRIPEELNKAQNQFSVDVLIYFPFLDEHTIGWFDFTKMKWRFLANQDYKNHYFIWRYFENETDKLKFKNVRDYEEYFRKRDSE